MLRYCQCGGSILFVSIEQIQIELKIFFSSFFSIYKSKIIFKTNSLLIFFLYPKSLLTNQLILPVKKNRFLKEKKSHFLSLCCPGILKGSLKNVCQFGPAVWPAIANINKNIYTYMSEELYNIVQGKYLGFRITPSSLL